MEEVKRTTKYILPGITVIFVLALFCFISLKSELQIVLSDLKFDKTTNIVIGLLILIVSSGTIGYLLSIIYYPIINLFFKFLLVDHRSVFRECSNKINIISSIKNCNFLSSESLTKREAWILMNQLWNKYSENELIKGYNLMNGRMANILNGLGTSFVGFIISYFIWFYIYMNLKFDWDFIFISILWGILIMLTYCNYSIVKKNIEINLNSILLEVINKKAKDDKLDIYYIKK